MTDPGSSHTETDRLQRLLDATLPAEEEAQLVAELERDESRRRILEDLAAEPQFREDVHAFLSRPADDDASVFRILDAVQELVREAQDPCLDFLEPDDRPEYIGRFDGYPIIDCIGSGGMGIVLKAFDPSLNRVVAIKVLAPPLAASVNARKRFLREARAAAAVSHDHVITIHAVNSDGALPYLVTEFVEGVSLADKLNAEGPLPVNEILRIARQTASGLAAAHAQGLIHRDIKPGNILLENGVQRVKITDFGLARAANDSSVTRTGDVVGTPQFMAPEQARGEPLDCRADLFSLGSVMYAMCTGESPFRTDSVTGTIRRVCDEQPRSISELNPDIPAWLIDIVDRLHAKAPEDRYESASEVEELLTARLAEIQRGATVLMPASRRVRRFRLPARPRAGTPRFAVLALIVVVAAGIIWWFPVANDTPGNSTDAVSQTNMNSATGPARSISPPNEARVNAEREVARWTLARNGEVKLFEHGRVTRQSQLPETSFQIQGIHLWHRGVKDRDARRFLELSRLQALDLRGNQLTDDSIPILGELTSLRWLYLGKMRISDANLECLNRLTKVEALALDGTSITDDGVTKLRGLAHLRELLVGSTAITDRSLQHLADWSSLVRLDLFGTDITDAGLQHLDELVNLKYLILQQTAVTDEGLEHLKSLPALKELNLKQTAVTNEGVAAFRDVRPDCTVDY
ncbi:Serine/threonine-protein kinase PrkC [Maioricimonas rarisocia]|uniref:non-specific serine/threonine protein kinase n=1 Tax=Maioricimonas rarisocia TaxID=2528026 RepID=A0A517ZA88_9PLAN|nr:protein kinase [Maioricimonas rarisocia]QDU39329.1 Serine/threonine-protein kinase PrkC [Maioricimonas rarisocia]